jgi:multidrug resistance efflux pump
MDNYSPPPPESLDQLHQKIETGRRELREMQQNLTTNRKKFMKQQSDYGRKQTGRNTRVLAVLNTKEELSKKKTKLQKMEEELAAEWDDICLTQPRFEK